MNGAAVLHQLEPCETSRQLVRGVAHNVEATAPGRSVARKRSQDQVPIESQSPFDARYIALLVGHVGQKVKDGTIVPQVERVFGQFTRQDVRFEPRYRGTSRPKTLLRPAQGARGYIENRQIGKARVEKVVHQGRGATAHVDDLGTGRSVSLRD
jgi:hypothetical protein